jgi:hypothetical protein
MEILGLMDFIISGWEHQGFQWLDLEKARVTQDPVSSQTWYD